MNRYNIKFEDECGIRNVVIKAISEYQAEEIFEKEPSHSRCGKGKIISIVKLDN